MTDVNDMGLSAAIFTAQYGQSLMEEEPMTPAGPSLTDQFDEWIKDNDVMPVAVDLNQSQPMLSGDGTMRSIVHVMTVVYMPRAMWELQQSKIMANAMAIRKGEEDGQEGSQEDSEDRPGSD